MKMWRIGIVGLMLLAGCGVPREAGRLAAQEAALSATVPADDAAVRQRLIEQETAWRKLSLLVAEREWGGLPVDDEFIGLVKATAAVATRQRTLIEQHQDDPTLNRQALERFEGLWKSAGRYLGK